MRNTMGRMRNAAIAASLALGAGVTQANDRVCTSLDHIMGQCSDSTSEVAHGKNFASTPLPPEVDLERDRGTLTLKQWEALYPEAAAARNAAIDSGKPLLPESDYEAWKERQQELRSGRLDIPGEPQSPGLKLPFDLQVYGTEGEGSNGVESYTGGGATLRTDNFVGTAELGDGYTHASAVGTLPVGDNGAYIKGGAAHLKRNVTLGGETKGVKQTTLGGAVGMGNDVHNIEFGVITSDVARTTFPGYVVDPGDAVTTYVEAILRYTPNMGQFDVALSAENTSLGDNDYGNARFTTTYYPTTNQGITFGADTMEPSQDWNAQAGFNASFDTMGDLLSGRAKWSPYFTVAKGVGKHMDIAYTWRHGVAEDPLNLKDRFERGIQTTDLTAQELAPNSFAQVVEEPIEEVITPADTEAPSITSGGTQSYNVAERKNMVIDFGEAVASVTYTVNAGTVHSVSISGNTVTIDYTAGSTAETVPNAIVLRALDAQENVQDQNVSVITSAGRSVSFSVVGDTTVEDLQVAFNGSATISLSFSGLQGTDVVSVTGDTDFSIVGTDLHYTGDAPANRISPLIVTVYDQYGNLLLTQGVSAQVVNNF